MCLLYRGSDVSLKQSLLSLIKYFKAIKKLADISLPKQHFTFDKYEYKFYYSLSVLLSNQTVFREHSSQSSSRMIMCTLPLYVQQMHSFRIEIKIYMLTVFFRLYIIYSITFHILYTNMYKIYIGMGRCAKQVFHNQQSYGVRWQGEQRGGNAEKFLQLDKAQESALLVDAHSGSAMQGMANLSTHNQCW